MEMGRLSIFEEHACSELSVPDCYFKNGQLLQYFKKGHILNQRKALVRSFHSFWVWKSALIFCLHLHSSASAQDFKWESIFKSVVLLQMQTGPCDKGKGSNIFNSADKIKNLVPKLHFLGKYLYNQKKTIRVLRPIIPISTIPKVYYGEEKKPEQGVQEKNIS